MNKADVVNIVAVSTDLSKAAAGDVVEAVLSGIIGELRRGGSVGLIGFGTFSVAARAPRTARNPRTGEPISVPASNAPKFKASKVLKDALK